MVSLIRATNLWGFAPLVRELGADPERLLSRFDITPGVEHEDDAFVPLDRFVGLLETCAAELASPDFGLRLARWQGLDILGPIAVIARNASTVRDGLGSIARYLYVHSPALTLAVEPRGDDLLQFTYRVTEGSLTGLRQGYELSMANAVRLIALLGGGETPPSFVSFLHERIGPETSYAEALGCPVRFGQPWCGFELPVASAARPIDSADPETRRIATKYLEAEYPPLSAPLADRVAELTRRLLPTGQCSADVIADHLLMHPRTLQRRLAEEGARCQDIIDGQRRDLAAKYLAEPRFELAQIAGLLGYAEQSTLNRSCRRWFGQTPRQLRSGRL